MEYRIEQQMDLKEKLQILSDAAKYDVACTSSGVERKNTGRGTGNCIMPGICHSFSADGRCISLLKILFTNECIFDCRYCINRRSNDVPRASFTPQEVCDLVMGFYRRNYIEGLFLSSGILMSPDTTMDLLYQTLYKLRREYHFQGYIHVKAIPGADPELVERTGYLADRMSVNLELPTAEGLQALAPQKQRPKMLAPIRQVYRQRKQNRHELTLYRHAPKFVPAGQSTQMIVGASGESDWQIMKVAEHMYRKYEMKRVFYSAFLRVNEDRLLPVLPGGPPLLREHRLYQADWLLRSYGFRAEELLDEETQDFDTRVDPKCSWALAHLDAFPVEVNTAAYETLLRIPGVGVTSARRILSARRVGPLHIDGLRKLGVVMKRAQYFLTASGKMAEGLRFTPDSVLRGLIAAERPSLPQQEMVQLSLFDQAGTA